MNRLLRRYADRTSASDQALYVPPAQAWHLFESHLVLTGSRNGKCYKNWMFDRLRLTPGLGLDAVQGGACAIMRDAAREFLLREQPDRETVSLFCPVHSASGDPLTLEDLLPDQANPLSLAEEHEWEELAQRHADSRLADMAWRERIAVLAKELGLSLASPAVETLAGCRKSVLAKAYREFVMRLALFIKEGHPAHDAAWHLTLCRAVMAFVREAIIRWGKAEEACAALFMLDGARTVPLPICPSAPNPLPETSRR